MYVIKKLKDSIVTKSGNKNSTHFQNCILQSKNKFQNKQISWLIFTCTFFTLKCCILTFDPAKHAIPKTAEVTHSDGSYGKKWRRRVWLTIWDKLKSHGTVRLMHGKRVTCELHDSYFRLMTIKHAIPKILSGRLNYYITRWRQEVSVLETRPVGDKMR